MASPSQIPDEQQWLDLGVYYTWLYAYRQVCLLLEKKINNNNEREQKSEASHTKKSDFDPNTEFSIFIINN